MLMILVEYINELRFDPFQVLLLPQLSIIIGNLKLQSNILSDMHY